ncbi:MAG: hypothetical protein ABI467_14675 [Kofleriaceae bacterium]
MTNKLLACVVVAAAGCGTMQQPASATGDDDGSGIGSAMPPDGGTSDGSDGSGSGTIGQPGALTGHVLDERNDTIDFSSGQPLHTHGGSAIALAEGSCADVYKYAYLMSALPPMYGHENAVNPIAWQVAGGDTNPSQTSYRVRDDANHTLLDWTTTTADVQGQYAITLYRDGAHGIPAIGTTEGTIHLDVRFHDLQGNEIIKSGCWVNHPLAAPIFVGAPDLGGLFNMTLPANAPISSVMTTPGVPYRTFKLRQQTAEPITLELSAPAPGGTVSKMAVDTWVNIGTTPVLAGPCSESSACDQPSIPTSSTPSTAPLVAGWSIVIVDETTNTTLCSAMSLNLTCTLPPRAANQPAHDYLVQIFVGGVIPLHVGGNLDVNSEWTAGTFGMYTGTAPGTTVYYCDTIKPHLTERYCVAASQRQHIVALDRATVAFDAIGMSLLTYGSATGVTPSYLPANALAIPAQTWDAGDKGLPLN